MAFKQAVEKEHSFKSWDELERYAGVEQAAVEMVPLWGFIKSNASFMDDEFFGDCSVRYNVNKAGFSKLCNLLRVPKEICERIVQEGMATDLLNDALSREDIRRRFRGRQLVVKNGTIIGVVSEKYLGYSNRTFLADVKTCLGKRLDRYEFATSYVVNSNLYLRVLSAEIRAGVVSGRGGLGEDSSRVGLEFRNSMIGESSIRAAVFVHRLACANGLVVTGTTADGRVMHYGKAETLSSRIDSRITPVFKKLKTTAAQIELLGDMVFDAGRLVEAGAAKIIYSIISPSRCELEKRRRLRGDKRLEFDAQIVAAMPEKHGGALTQKVFSSYWRDEISMFDFINVFTEFAKEQAIPRRMQVEEQAGNLAAWIHKNRKKFA